MDFAKISSSNAVAVWLPLLAETLRSFSEAAVLERCRFECSKYEAEAVTAVMGRSQQGLESLSLQGKTGHPWSPNEAGRSAGYFALLPHLTDIAQVCFQAAVRHVPGDRCGVM